MVKLERSHPFDVGVLLVHGIGEQRKGDTLVECGGPLIEVLRQRLERLGGGVRRRQTARADVSVQTTRLNVGGAAEPAHAELALHGLEGLRTPGTPHADESSSRWLIAESWWADAFPQPSYREVLLWAVRTLPATVISHFDEHFRRTLFTILNPDNLEHRPGKSLRLARDLVGLGLAAVFLPPLLCALILLIFAGALPIPYAEAIGRWVQQRLAATVGDSFILLDKSIARAAIVDTVRRDLSWLAQRCERIAVIAHSQGGAIAHEAIRGDPLSECELLLTYGSGLHKLALLERMTGGARNALLWAAILGFFVASLAGLAIVRDLWGGQMPAAHPGGIGWSLALAAMSFLVGGLALFKWLGRAGKQLSHERQWEADRRLFDTRFRLLNGRVRWTDVYASRDPIPNGPLLDEFRPPELNTREVWNLGSPLLDHTSYWQSRDDFVSRAAGRLLSLTDIDVYALDPDESDRQDAGSARRRWRLVWRRAGNWLALAATLLVAARLHGEPPPAMNEALAALAARLGEVPVLGPWLAGRGTTPLFLALAVAAYFLLAAALRRLWALSNHAEMSAFFSRGAFAFWSWPMLLYWLPVVAILAAATLYGLGPPVLWFWGGLALVAALAMLGGRAGLPQLGAGRDALLAWSASGPLEELRERWRRRDQLSLDRNIRKRHRWSIYRMGLRLIGKEAPEDRARGVAALREAMGMGVQAAAERLGAYYRDLRDYTAARDAYLQGKNMGDPYCAWRLGILLEQELNDPEGAIEAYEEALHAVPEPFRGAAHDLGYLFERRPSVRRALRAYRQGVALADPLSAAWLGRLYEQLARKREAAGNRRSAEVLYRAAAERYRQAIDLGEGAEAHNLGDLLLRRGDRQGAIRAFEAGVRLRWTPCALELGKLLKLAGRLAEAEQAWHRAIELAGERGGVGGSSVAMDAAWELGQVQEARGQKDAALRFYELAAGVPGQEAGRPEAALRLAEHHLETNDRDAAEFSLRRGHELSSSAAGVRLAELLYDRGRSDESLAVLRKAAWTERRERWRSNRTSAAILAYGATLERNGRDARAMAAYLQGISLGSPEAEVCLVDLLVNCLDGRTACTLAARRHYWRSSQAGIRLARLLLAEGHGGEAGMVLATMRPDDPVEQVEVARLCEVAGNPEEASWRYAVAMRAGSSDAAQGLSRLLRAQDDAFGADSALRRAEILAPIGPAASPEKGA